VSHAFVKSANFYLCVRRYAFLFCVGLFPEHGLHGPEMVQGGED
jgi:hypothetical protein